MVALLYKKENITGKEVREIIINFEKENNIKSRVSVDVDDIAEELKEDAKMAKKDTKNDDKKKEDSGKEDEQ
jgi:cell division protease FtsH